MPHPQLDGTRRVSQRTLLGRAERFAAHTARVDELSRLRRFLVLGSEHGRYDASAPALGRGDAQAVERCLRADGRRVVAEIVATAAAGRAPRPDPALFALAMAAGLGDDAARRSALDALPRVAATGEELRRFAAFAAEFRGWGRSLRRAVGAWYAGRPVDAIAEQAVTGRDRDGLSHRDLLRLAHPGRRVSARNPAVATTPEHDRLFEWIVRGGSTDGLPRVVEGFVRARAAATPAAAARLVSEYGLPRQAVRPEHLAAREVWEALLPALPLPEVLHNLVRMTRAGALAPGSEVTAAVVALLGDPERVRRSGVQPVALLSARRAYGAGRAMRGRRRWTPVTEVLDALDAAFAAAVRGAAPTGGRTLLALDVSHSMDWGHVAGLPGVTPRDAAAALALAAAATGPRHEIAGFSADGLGRLDIAPDATLADAIGATARVRFGGTDCALPILHAQAHEREVDTFVVVTDCDTRWGDVHPARALRAYREASGIDARLVVVGLASSGFAIADPGDAGMLDVVGFDAAVPQLIADFARHLV